MDLYNQGQINKDFAEMSRLQSKTKFVVQVPRTKKEAIQQVQLFAEFLLALGESEKKVLDFVRWELNRFGVQF